MDTPFPESILWLSVPTHPRSGTPWKANPFADKDAPGLTHYMGFGDVNGDGRPDIATGAKGSPSPVGNYFAWWEAPADPARPWKKHVIAERQMGGVASGFVAQERATVFGGEDEMNVNGGKRLWHVGSMPDQNGCASVKVKHANAIR